MLTSAELRMTDIVAAFRSAFDATPEAPAPVGRATVSNASAAIKHANGQLQILAKTESFTEAHATAMQAASQSLRRSARALEVLEAGIRDHLANGYSAWTGTDGAETPVLL